MIQEVSHNEFIALVLVQRMHVNDDGFRPPSHISGSTAAI